MLGIINVTVRMEENVKKESEQVLNELGLTMSAAVNIFMRTIARQKRIPFELTLVETDPFFSETNMARIALSKKQINEGNVIFKTAQELGLDNE